MTEEPYSAELDLPVALIEEVVAELLDYMEVTE
jgi:hypothetical protein